MKWEKVPSGARVLLYVALVLVNVSAIAVWIRTARRRHLHERPSPIDVAIGFVTNFSRYLGIGSYAQITAMVSNSAVVLQMSSFPGNAQCREHRAAFPRNFYFFSGAPWILSCLLV